MIAQGARGLVADVILHALCFKRLECLRSMFSVGMLSEGGRSVVDRAVRHDQGL